MRGSRSLSGGAGSLELMRVRFLKHFTIETTTFYRDGLYHVPTERAERWIMAGLCEPVNDPPAAAGSGELEAEPAIETGARVAPETTSRRRRL